MDTTMTHLKLDRDGRGYHAFVKLAPDCAVKAANPDFTHIKVQVDYDIGGQNMWGGNPSKRGYRLAVKPVELGDNMESCKLLGNFATSGGYFFIEATKAFNAKTMAGLARAFDPKVELIASIAGSGVPARIFDVIRELGFNI